MEPTSYEKNVGAGKCTNFKYMWFKYFAAWTSQWTIPLKEAAGLLWYFYRDPLRSLTLLSLNVLSQKS